MYFEQINIEETHIRLTTDLNNQRLKKTYIRKNKLFQLSQEPIKVNEDNLPAIIQKMYFSSDICDVGPMACVAGTISELSLNYLIENDSKYSIVENGGDIALINDSTVLCGIYSNNEILGNDIAFKLKAKLDIQ